MSERAGHSWSVESVIFIVASLVVMALWQFWPAIFSPRHQVLILVIGVALMGLPHGALDPLRAWYGGLWKDARGCALFHLAYVAAALAVVALWYVFPVAGLGLFLLYSAVHFAGDWRGQLPLWMRLSVGLAIVVLPVSFHSLQVAEIFALLAGDGGYVLADVLRQGGWLLLPALLAIIVVQWRKNLPLALELTVLAAAVAVLPPLLFFLLYFCLLHNGRHLYLCFHATPQQEKSRFFAVALLYTLLTLALVGLALPWLQNLNWQQLANQLVFIGLAALTLPHMLLSLIIRPQQ